eukprot:1878526-Rhodomonas_salina.1
MTTTETDMKTRLDANQQELPATSNDVPSNTPLLETPTPYELSRSETDKQIDAFIDAPAAPADLLDEQEATETLHGIEDENEDEEISESAAMWGAAGAGCGAGYVIGGVFLGLVGAAGGAYAATKQGKIGEAARSSGRVVVTLGRKASKFNQEHKVTEKAKKACVAAYTSIKETNEKHKITERTGKAFKGGFESAKTFNERNQITTKIASAAATGMKKVEGLVTKKNTADDASMADNNNFNTQYSCPAPAPAPPVQQTPSTESFV